MGFPVFASSAPLPTSTMKCRRACRHAGAAIVHCCGHQTTPRTTCDDWWGDDAKHHGCAEFCISRSRTTCSRQSSISLCCAYKYITLIPAKCISGKRGSLPLQTSQAGCTDHKQQHAIESIDGCVQQSHRRSTPIEGLAQATEMMVGRFCHTGQGAHSGSEWFL